MHRAHRAITARANARTIAELGVSSTQLAAVYLVAKNPGCSMTDVATVLDLNKSAMSGTVQRLERAGILRREPNPRDGRGSRLSLTEKGEAIRTRSLQVVRRITAELTEGFDADEVETITRFLNSVVDRFTEEASEEDA